MTEPFVSSRFLIREKPTAYPFYDLIHQDSQGPVFDLNVQMDSYDGSVYLRTDHVIEMARTLGMATVEEVAEFQKTITELKDTIASHDSQEDLKSELNDIVGRIHTFLSPAPVEPDPALFDIPVAEPDNPKPPQAERKTIGSISL